MTCKFTVVCKSCKCRTELAADRWTTVGRFLCPNCRKEMPDTAYRFLCDAMNAIAVVPSNIEGFTVTIGDCDLSAQRN